MDQCRCLPLPDYSECASTAAGYLCVVKLFDRIGEGRKVLYQARGVAVTKKGAQKAAAAGVLAQIQDSLRNHA
jgi:hypothetical protein